MQIYLRKRVVYHRMPYQYLNTTYRSKLSALFGMAFWVNACHGPATLDGNHPLEHDIKVFFASINSGVDMWTLEARSIKKQAYHTLRHNCVMATQHSSSIFPVVIWFGASIVFEPWIPLILYSLDEHGLDYVSRSMDTCTGAQGAVEEGA